MKKLFSIILTVLLCLLCLGSAPPEPREESEVDRIDNAIEFLLSKGLPKHKIFPHPRHRLLKKPEIRQEVSNAIYKASFEKGVPAPLLIAMGFREGSFKADSVGKLGEESMFQMMKRTAKLANRIDARCALDTVEGSAMCSAIWLRHWKEKCGNWKGSLVVYATGGPTCKSLNSHVEWLIKDRIGIARKLTKRFWKDSNDLHF